MEMLVTDWTEDQRVTWAVGFFHVQPAAERQRLGSVAGLGAWEVGLRNTYLDLRSGGVNGGTLRLS